MVTIAVMDASLTTTSMFQGCSAPLPHPTSVASLSPCQQPSTPASTPTSPLRRDRSPHPKQHWEGRRRSSSSLSATPSASSASHASYTGAYEVAVAAETRCTDVGGSLLKRPIALPLCTVKSYGTTSDIGDDNSNNSLSAVVTAYAPNEAFDLMATQTTGSSTTSSHAEFRRGQLEHHAQHTQQRQGPVRLGDAVEFSKYDPHLVTPLGDSARMVGGVEQSDPVPLARGMPQEPLAREQNTNAGAAPAEGRSVPATSFLSRSAESPTGPPPSFVGLVVRRVQSTSLLQFLWVVLLMAMLLVGNAFQVIFLNFWIHQFPSKQKPPISPASSSSESSSSSSGGGGGDGDHVKALASSYTTFLISAVVFPAFFMVLFIMYALWRRPNLGFAREWAGWRLLLGIGAMDALNSALAIYAAANTPEVLQALFISLVPIYSAIFTKWLLKDPRDYANPYVVVSFLLIATGVALASLFNYAVTHHHHTQDRSGSNHAASKDPLFDISAGESSSSRSPVALDRQLWCLIFFLSVPPTVLMNVWQTMYMIRYANNEQLMAYLDENADEAEDEERNDVVAASVPGQHTPLLGNSGDSHNDVHHPPSPAAVETAERMPLQPSSASASTSVLDGEDDPQHRLRIPRKEHLLHGDDVSVKLVMLTSDTAIQAVLAFVLMPVDALPWFGGSDSLREVVQNLDDGIDCVLHCPHNMRYCIMYSTGFVLVYIASAYLNRYSVTLCSMVSQLSGPITALVLILFPSLNMTADASPWYVSIFSIVMLACGTIMYVYWDEATAEEKAEGEMQLKWAMMQEQSLGRAPSSAEGDRCRVIARDVNASQSSVSPPQQHRRSLSRRYRRCRKVDYAVVVDQDASDVSASGQRHPH
ncbi:hypothetical protein LtaPh_0306000 [Leishmania tarentolae]|uniref:Uncharacterized protein n=1 Tax=Leishmania tarentolae TaxID=5689 RepID=A0A640K8E1_LEITA|nr:hypothetical protein LtaPh_0306000 [Leishmania tarentolae]